MMAFREIPLVDISGLGDTDPARHAKTVEDIRKAASQVGFLYVSGHGIPAETIARLRAATEAFFARPQDEKMKVYIGNSRNHRGYVPEGEEVFYGGSKDKKEAFDLSIDLPADDPDYVSGNPLLGPNQWPEDMPEFHDAVSAYYDAIFALGHRLLHGFAEALGLEPTALDEYFAKPPSQLRLIHYPYDPPPVEGAFVVNIGDMLEVWSNGVFTATSHRVRKVQEERYSFPLFFSCDYWTKVEPLPAFVSADRPAAYPPVIAGEHLHAQTVQTFTYLKERLARGEIDMPEGSLGLSSFGREARVRGT